LFEIEGMKNDPESQFPFHVVDQGLYEFHQQGMSVNVKVRPDAQQVPR
jgi:hypothetical protein